MWELEGRLRMCTFSVFPSVFLAPLKLPKADFTFFAAHFALGIDRCCLRPRKKKEPKKSFFCHLLGEGNVALVFSPSVFFAPEFRDSSFVGARQKKIGKNKWGVGASEMNSRR